MGKHVVNILITQVLSNVIHTLFVVLMWPVYKVSGKMKVDSQQRGIGSIPHSVGKPNGMKYFSWHGYLWQWQRCIHKWLIIKSVHTETLLVVLRLCTKYAEMKNTCKSSHSTARGENPVFATPSGQCSTSVHLVWNWFFPKWCAFPHDRRYHANIKCTMGNYAGITRTRQLLRLV